ncbi:hypothetical protein GQ44DRAFT_689723 [Phaeosphaeriaceae sp. PMI808]|nr:hypothetical protein GQ44DRAFT_689723 [Phaeosphaeriaceae sp. PMI808]
MGLDVLSSISSLTWIAGVALFAAQLFPHNTDSYVPVCSELVCWIIVILFYDYLPRFCNGARLLAGTPLEAPAHTTLHILTVAMAVTLLSSSINDNVWIMPAVTVILVALRRTSYLPHFQHAHPEYYQTVWSPMGVGAVSIFALAPALTQTKLATAVMFLLGLAVLYGCLIRIFETAVNESTQSEIVPVVRSIAARAIGVSIFLGIVLMLVLIPGTAPHLGKVVLAGGMKAAHWIAMLRLAQEVSWEAATTIWTCAAASRGAFTPSAGASLGLLQAFSRCMVALSASYQTVNFLPKTARGRSFLFILTIWPFLSLVQHVPLSGKIAILPGEIWTSTPPNADPQTSPRHPVEQLILKAQVDFALLINKQSKTLNEAETEYRKRYSREPPPGFDKWFSYAQLKGSVLIDNFDMINHDLQPFWRISPQRLLEGIDHASSDEQLALRKCGFAQGQYHAQGGGWIVEDLGKLLEEVSQDLPNVDFAFDVVDEPRVVITQEMLDKGGVAKPEFINESHKSIWSRVTAACSITTMRKHHATAVHDYGIPFVQDWTEAKDVCLHPEFEHMHGLFSSPATCIMTDAPIPVLSQAAPTSFGDIMYPSPWYTEKDDQGNYKDGEDPPWEQKTDTLYWAGSTTGSHSTNGSWRYSHRQRFVQLVQTLNETNHKYLKQMKPGVWGSYEAVEDHSNLFDVKLTAVIQCDEKDCEEQKQFFSPAEREERGQQFQSRFVFDADGNSFSGRYHTLLRSRSVVLKQTVLREWHDERLIPWVHYIPVTLSMEELPELMRYLTNNDDGRQRAKEIADAGREWHSRVLRKEDFTVYLYRLMLELARIMDPQRYVE